MKYQTQEVRVGAILLVRLHGAVMDGIVRAVSPSGNWIGIETAGPPLEWLDATQRDEWLVEILAPPQDPDVIRKMAASSGRRGR